MKPFRSISLLLIIFSMATVRMAWAQSAYSFLNNSTSAKQNALGGYAPALADNDLVLGLFNPALSGDTLNHHAAVHLHFLPAGATTSVFSYQPIVGNSGAWQFSLVHTSYGSIDAFDAAGNALGNANAADTYLSIAKRWQVGLFRVGVQAKPFFSNLAGNRSNGLAMDIGGVFQHPTQALSVGLVLRNIGFIATEYAVSSEDNIPLDVQLGITFKPKYMPFRFSLTAIDLTDFDTPTIDAENPPSTVDKVVRHINIGSELILSKNFNFIFAYNFRRRQDLQLSETASGAGISYGVWFGIKAFQFTLSRTSLGSGQGQVAFALSTNLNQVIFRR
ncbi:MAG: type IX secretion system protein PorQ [Flammeovirgaceae bacterium]|nr:type IX secretion system protein PorQ [Flammeovirgaceae bacterium]